MNYLLLNREYTLTVGTLKIKGLQVTFNVKKTLKTQPNTAEIKVYNLSSDHRKQIQADAAETVMLEAGYTDQTSVIFIGDLTTSQPSSYDGPNVITTIGGGDGKKAHQSKRVHAAHKKGSTSADVLRSLVNALGVLPGNSSKAIAAITSSGFGDRFTMGTVLSGSASNEMTRVLRDVGYTWSIQNGALQILTVAQAVSSTAIFLDETSGLVESPSIDKDGFLAAKMFIQPDVFPGRLIQLQSRDITGQFKVTETTHTGDFNGKPWYVDLKAKRY